VIRALLLDLGNVLVFHDNVLLLKNFAARAGLLPEALAARIPEGLWDRSARGEVDTEGMRAAMSAAMGVSLETDEFVALWCSHFRVYDEMLPRVEALVGRVPLVLVSNTNQAHFDWCRARVPVLERFNALVLSHALKCAKPDSRIFAQALQRAGVGAPEAAFFDDLPLYVHAAARLGIRARVFTTAEGFDADLAELGLR
jgi:FMN phosphatase YigB (HAD superfamily)